ncbi:hypothetical protein [Bradyrhizobium sp. RT5a]|uniref:hypothetical protein n=1 Tax=unclassified Bradyrhizobium TaxID=2631580 RepID=UPI003399F207
MSQTFSAPSADWCVSIKVIFFRDQKYLDEVEHERLVATLGNAGWQAICSDDDWSANITPHVDPGLSLLPSAAIAPGRRETAWSNMRAAYLDLRLPLRKLVDDLWPLMVLTLRKPGS